MSVRGFPGWHRSDLIPVTQPAAIGGKFIFYDGSGRHLHVVALDARSGKTAWSKLASISDVTPGVSPALDVSGPNVIALLSRAPATDVAVVSEIEASTGKVVWTSAPGRFTSTPSPCPGDPKVVCVTGSLVNGRATGGLRFELATGKTLAPVALGAGARELGDGLLDPGLRKPEYLVAVRASAVSWRRPLATIFGPGSSSDYGWNVARVDKLGLFVGSVSFTPLKETKTFVIADLAHEMTVGFRIANGTTVWRNRGALFACGPLPCPGQLLAGYVVQSAAPTSEPVVGVRLRMKGTLKVTYSLKFVASPDARVTLEGFNPADGRTTWRFDAGRSVGLMTQELQPPQTGVNRIVLRDRRGRYVELDLRTGTGRTIAATTRGWCRSAVTYPQAVPYVTDKHTFTTYIGQDSLFPCDATGKRLPTPLRVPPVAGKIGATADGLVAWSDRTGVVAAPAA